MSQVQERLDSAAIDAIAFCTEGIRTIDEYKDWIRNGVRPVFPHEMLVSGYGHLHAGGVSLDYVVTVDFPLRYLQQLRNRAGAIDTPVLRRWFATREPQLFELDRPWADVPAAWLEAFRENGLVNIASHGTYDAEGCVASYVSFHRIPGRLGEAHVDALRRLAPIVHKVLGRVLGLLSIEDKFATRFAGLRPREKEIAQWVGLGKTNGEIARLSRLSENTVKHHLTSIFAKLEVESRAQLVHRLAEFEAKSAPGFGTKIL